MTDWHPDVEAAMEFVRRANKGLPDDRWADGKEGMRAVKRGIERFAAAVLRMSSEKEAAARAAMEVSKDPMRE